MRKKRQPSKSNKRKPVVRSRQSRWLSLFNLRKSMIEKDSKLDTQQVELMGRNLLVSYFIADGVEVALPLRDRGVDLIAFDDLGVDGNFRAIPVQLKASSKKSFSVHKKYDKFPELLMAYIWNAADPLDAALYVMTYKEACDIADGLGWTTTESWILGTGYSTQSPSKKVLQALEKYKYRPGYLAKVVQKATGHIV